MADDICGAPYTLSTPVGPVAANCLRDKGHDKPGFRRGFWPPPANEAERQEMLEAYREHGYEDRTPY